MQTFFFYSPHNYNFNRNRNHNRIIMIAIFKSFNMSQVFWLGRSARKRPRVIGVEDDPTVRVNSWGIESRLLTDGFII